LDVLRLCLDSLLANTRHPFDLMIFDNGSCVEVQDYLIELRRRGNIQYLILSQHNLRKLGALDFLLSVAPGEIISYADSDVYFLRGWLDASIEILESFPEAGQVTAIPTADKVTDYCSSTYNGIRRDNTVVVETAEALIPRRFIEAHRASIGKSREAYDQTLGDRQDTRVTRDGVSAYVSAQDFQYTTTREAIDEVLPLKLKSPEEYYDPLYSPAFEARLDELGFWRLSTVDYLVHHIGNTMPSSAEGADWVFEQDLLERGAHQEAVGHDMPYLKRKLLHNRYSRRLLKRINTLTYSLLYEE
jgi:glycosyltransferase involved in cell wall biosynthesis